MTRGEKAGAGMFGKPPTNFSHTPATEPATKPDLPDGLSSGEQAEVSEWLSLADSGSEVTKEPLSAHYTANAIVKIEEFKTYRASAEYKSYKLQEDVRRDAQWRILNVDAIEEAITLGTVPISADSGGAGANPATGDIPAS